MITTTRVWVRIGTWVGMDGIEGLQGQTTTTVDKVKCLTEIETGWEVRDAHTNTRTIRTSQTTPCLRRLTRSAWRRGSLRWAPLSWPRVTPHPGVNPPENPTVSRPCCLPHKLQFLFFTSWCCLWWLMAIFFLLYFLVDFPSLEVDALLLSAFSIHRDRHYILNPPPNLYHWWCEHGLSQCSADYILHVVTKKNLNTDYLRIR